jgi:hypothetical protein
MTINRTTLLDLPLPVTGTESGTWGDVTNNGLSQYVDIAVAGMNALTSSDFTDGALTISNTLGTSAATNIAAGSAQYATIKVSSLIQDSTITAPASNRSYRIINADSTRNLTIKASGEAGITFLPGQTGVVAFTGTDYEVVGVVNAASSTDNAVPRFDGTTGQIIKNSGVTIDDSNNVSGVAQLNATTADLTNIEVTNIKAKDGTSAGSIADSTGVVTLASSVLTTTDINGGTIDGAVIGGSTAAAGSFTTLTTSSTVTHNGGTANGVAFLNGSNVLTTGSALSFNGTVLQNTQSSAADGIMMGLQNTTTGSFIQFSQPAVANLLFGCPNADAFVWKTFGSGTYPERMRIDSSGNLLVGTTTSPSGSGNLAIGAGAWIPNTNYFQLVPKFTGSNGDYYFYDDTAGFFAFPDDYQQLGNPSYRWTTVYATTGTINTSDATTKQQIRSLNDAEKAVAQSIKGLIKAYKFNNSVAKKGDGARIHTGVIAQDVQAAFVAEGLDPTRYGLFCSDTWYEVDGKAKPQDGDFYTSETPNAIEVTRLGLRYEELLAFVIAAM